MGIRGELFSTRVLLQNRTYFFNVKENRLGDLYLNIVESKNRDEGGFERQSVILFAEDLQEFLKGFDESLRVLEKAVREKRKGKSGGGEDRNREDRSREDKPRESRSREDRPREGKPWENRSRDDKGGAPVKIYRKRGEFKNGAPGRGRVKRADGHEGSEKPRRIFKKTENRSRDSGPMPPVHDRKRDRQ